MSENTPTTTPYTVPDNPADPEAAALDLIVRSTEVLDDPVVTAGVQEFALLLEVEGAFTGMSWPDAREAAKAIAFDSVLLRGKAVESLRRRATDALAGSDGKPWQGRATAARALNIAAKVLGVLTTTIPVPPGAEARHDWESDDPPRLPWRVVYGRTRKLKDGRGEVETSALQYADGTINTADDPPRISVNTYTDEGLTIVEARELAAMLMDAADEVDGWVSEERLNVIARCPMCDADGWLWGAGEDGDPIRCDHQTDS